MNTPISASKFAPDAAHIVIVSGAHTFYVETDGRPDDVVAVELFEDWARRGLFNDYGNPVILSQTGRGYSIDEAEQDRVRYDDETGETVLDLIDGELAKSC